MHLLLMKDSIYSDELEKSLVEIVNKEIGPIANQI